MRRYPRHVVTPRSTPAFETVSAAAMAQLQEQQYDADHDYERGSPHLRHASIRNEVLGRITSLVGESMARSGRCRVLEIGAGHGGFTSHLVASGAQVTVTEMSRPRLDALRRRLGPDAGVRLLYDRDGEAVFRDGGRFDLVLCISVLHHVPDYLHFVRRLVDRVDPLGAFASFQDPLWYPRRTRLSRVSQRAAYYGWRLTQPNRREGLQTLVRRARRTLDSTKPADMVEYHVVRDGVDEVALGELLSARFATVEEWRYWSTQSRLLQAAGERMQLESTFGTIARGRRHGR